MNEVKFKCEYDPNSKKDIELTFNKNDFIEI